MSEPVVEIKDLRFRYPGANRDALNGLSLSIAKGTMHGLIGPNGAGKTTLLTIITGARRGFTGRSTVLGLPSGDASLHRRVSYAPQTPSVAPMLTVRENLRLFASFYGLRASECKARAANWESKLGLTKASRQQARELSGGTLKRLSLGAALVAEPELIIADEATAGVDPQSRETIGDILREMRDRGCTVLYSTHYIAEVDKVCDEVTMIDAGAVVESGAVADYRCESGSRIEDRFLELTGRELRE
jgi:ABC-2 type transport system ATP-binding protein